MYDHLGPIADAAGDGQKSVERLLHTKVIMKSEPILATGNSPPDAHVMDLNLLGPKAERIVRQLPGIPDGPYPGQGRGTFGGASE